MFYNYTLNDRELIRKCYSYFMQDLKKGKYIDPYGIVPFDWITYMSPIERNFWAWCRELSSELYPQVPCGPYFIDFANSHTGVAYEIDGQEWHMNTEKDKKRENYIKAHGYKLFSRVNGRDTFYTPGEELEFEYDECD